MGMNSMEQQFTALFSATADRDRKFEAIAMLQQLLFCTPDYKQIIGGDPFEFLNQLAGQFHSRQHIEVKNGIASLIGVAGYCMVDRIAAFLDWALQNVGHNDANSVEVKALYLRSLQSHVFQSLVELLEHNESADLMGPLLDTTSQLASCYTTLFQSRFQNVADIVVGWCIDVSQPAAVTERCRAVLAEFRPFWLTESDFARRLMMNFLEDAEHYCDNISRPSTPGLGNNHAAAASGTSTPVERLTPVQMNRRVAVLLDLYSTVLCLTQPYFESTIVGSASQDVDVNRTFISDSLTCMHTFLTTAMRRRAAMDVRNIERVFKCAHDLISVSVISGDFKNLTNPYLPDVFLRFAELPRIVLGNKTCPSAVLCSALRFATQMFAKTPASLLRQHVDLFVSPSSVFLPTSRSRQVQLHTLNVYRSLLEPRDVSLLQAVYLYILTELHCCFARLDQKVPLRRLLLDDQEPPFDVDGYIDTHSEAWCATRVVFLVAALDQLGRTRGSVIAMWSISPSVFDLLCNRLPIANPRFAAFHGEISYDALAVLFSHCKVHDYFISSSAMLWSNSTSPAMSAMTRSPSSSCLADLIRLLTQLLKATFLCNDIHATCLATVNRIVTIAQEHKCTALFATPQFNDLAVAVCQLSVKRFTPNTETSQCLNSIVKVARDTLSSEFYTELFAALLLEVAMADGPAELPGVVAAAQKSRSGHVLSTSTHPYIPSLRQLHACVLRNCDAPLQPSQFTRLLDCVLMRGVEDGVPKSAIKWHAQLAPMFMTIQKPYKPAFCEVSCHVGLLWHFATWQLAYFCISKRLKTPMGEAQDTLTGIENVIKTLALQAIGKTTDAVLSTTSSVETWIRVRLLLSFVDALERQVCNACDSLTMTLYTPQKPVRVFFERNKSTCVAWLSRVRIPLMRVALVAGQHEVVVRNGYVAMQQLRAAKPKVVYSKAQIEELICILCCSLAALNCTAAVDALLDWARDRHAIEVQWLRPLSSVAAGSCERAIDQWSACIAASGTAVENTEARTNSIKFAYAKMVDCYRALSCWEEAANWLDNEHVGSNNDCISTADLEYLRSWNTLSAQVASKHTSTTASWSHSALVRRFELARIEMVEKDRVKVKGFGHSSLELDIRDELGQWRTACDVLQWPLEVFEESERIALMWQTDQVLSKTIKEPNTQTTTLLPFCLHWANKTNSHKPDVTAWLTGSAYHRDRENYRAARRCVANALQRLMPNCDTQVDLTQGLNHALTTASLVGSLQTNVQPLLQIAHELAKVEFKGTADDGQTAFGGLVEAVSTCMDSSVRDAPETRLLASCVCTLASWVDGVRDSAERSAVYGSLLLRNENSAFVKLLEHEINQSQTAITGINASAVVGVLYSMSVQFNPSDPTLHAQLADWTYNLAKTSLDSEAETQLILTAEDRAVVKEVLESASLNQHESAVLKVLSIAYCEGSQLTVRDRLVALSPHLELLSAKLLDIWKAANARLYHYLGSAATAYFKFLTLTDCGDLRNNARIVSTVLRLLNTLVVHWQPMQSLLGTQLDGTPPAAWKLIVPQLLSRLDHREPFVRERITRLLCSIAREFPQVLIYPAVVGFIEGADSSATALDDLLGDTETQDEDGEALDSLETEVEAKQDVSKKLHSCYQTLVEHFDQSLVESLKTFIRELQSIALLRDELWLNVLSHLKYQVDTRLRTLSKELDKTKRNAKLSSAEKEAICKEKKAIVTHLITTLVEIVYKSTCQDDAPSITPHNQWFIEAYAPHIERALRRAEDYAHDPAEAWKPMETILESLIGRSHQRTAMQLDLRQIAPSLCKLTDLIGSGIPLPGHTNDRVTVARMDPHVVILATKTRPKRLHFVGSDGKRYGYLFKGLEDLHLDERIMQFLSVCNSLFAQESNDGNRSDLLARHYNVIPLGPRCGILEWVDGATPLFHVYKRWLSKQTAESVQQQQQSGVATAAPANDSMRPSEIFMAKLETAVEKKGNAKFDKNVRSTWSLNLLRKAMQGLVTETPTDLIYKELWCRSANATEWWKSLNSFARSTAVMSMIGYVIGLGDRHLDNLLLDNQTGELVHVDYNICFERGRRLGVPERVPFRLTHNIVSALGLTGVEGVFRSTCTRVLSILRQNRAALLMLLQAFVHDPLVDWTTDANNVGAGFIGHHLVLAIYGKKRVEEFQVLGRDLASRMLRLRLQEVRPFWLENKHAFSTCIREMAERLSQIEDAQKQKESEQTQLQELRGLEEDLESEDMRHMVLSLPQRFAEYVVVRDEIAEHEQKVRTKLAECKLHAESYKNCFAALRNLGDFECRLSTISLSTPSVRALVSDLADFLATAGQSNAAQQHNEALSALSNTVNVMKARLADILNHLPQYVLIQKHMPASRFSRHRMFRWASALDSATSPGKVWPKADGQLVQLVSAQLQKFIIFREQTAQLTVAIERAANEAQTSLDVLMTSQKYNPICLLTTLLDRCIMAREVENRMHVSTNTALSFAPVCQHLINPLADASRSAVSLAQCLLAASPRPNEQLRRAAKLVTLLQTVFDNLASLHRLYSSTLLSHVLTAAVAEQKAIPTARHAIAQIVEAMGLSLPELTEGMRTLLLRCDTDERILLLVLSEARNHYTHYLSEWSQGENTSIYNLALRLCTLRASFAQLQSSINALATELNLLPEPDLLKQENSFASVNSICNCLEPALFLVELLAVNQTLESCGQFSSMFNGQAASENTNASTLLNEVLLDGPQFLISNVWQFCLNGLTTRCLAQLLLSAAADCELTDVATASSFDSASEAVRAFVVERMADCEVVERQNAEALVDQVEMAARTANTAATLSCLIPTAVLQVLSQTHAWLHDLPITLQRNEFFVTLKQLNESIRLSQSMIGSQVDRLASAESTIKQRLAWAAGANPDVAELSDRFDAAQVDRVHLLMSLEKKCKEVEVMCSALEHFEELATQDQCVQDAEVEQLIANTAACEQLRRSCSVVVTPTEERLLKLEPFDATLSVEAWLSTVRARLQLRLTDTRQCLQQSHTTLRSLGEELHALGCSCKTVLLTHQRVLGEVRGILRSLAKHEKCASSSQHRFRTFVCNYKRFSERVAAMVTDAGGIDVEVQTVVQLREDVTAVAQRLDEIYDSLLLLDDETQDGSNNEAERLDAVEVPSDGKMKETKATVVNAQALAIWRRIAEKLEGRDPDPHFKSSVEQQVDHLIAEATDIDNLALMYEGWTAWV